MGTVMETNKPEEHFIGFDIDDNVLKIIEKNKKFVKMELNKETGESMEVEEPPIAKNNHVNKKKQSKSSLSSPEPNDVENNRSNKSTVMETNKPEEHFIGFDIDDNVLKIIEKNKKFVKMELNEETGEPMEVEEPPIATNNHVNKRKQSKSSLSSPEPNDVKNNRSNKRHKKDNLHSDALESLELQVPPTLGISESMNKSSSTPEYISEDCQAIQSSASPKVSSPKFEKIDMNNTIIKRRNSVMNGSLRESVTPLASMKSFNDIVQVYIHIFKYLKTHELLSDSRVCTAWHIIAMNKYLWQNVCLKNSMVCDWEKFVDSIDQQRTDTLDTRCMLIPSKVEDFKRFWLRFGIAIKRAHKLKFIKLYRCPVHVIEDIINSLPQIEVLKATSIKNPNLTKQTKNLNDLMYLNLNYLGQMTNLTELTLKGLTGIKLTALPSFENLIHLNRFSLTSIKEFPKEIYQSLYTITDKIEFFEIGDCEYLTKDFAVSLKRFVNLKTLRLENCCNRWDLSAHDVFGVIRGLEKLNVLELVNIEFSNCVEDELEKCDNIKALLIIPTYGTKSAFTNRHLIDCLKKLSTTLKHLGLGLTDELLRDTSTFITQQNQHNNDYSLNLELSHPKENNNNIPISRTRKPRLQPGDEDTTEKEKDKSDYIDIFSVPALRKLLDTLMPDVRITIFKVPFSGTGRVYLNERFNDL